MTNLNNLKEYLDSKLNETTRPNNLYPKSRITQGFCDQLQYQIDMKNKDISDSDSLARQIMGANISDQEKDGNTVIQSASTTGAVGSPHYNEYELEKLQVKITSMESEVQDLELILKDFADLHKKVSGNKWLPRPKRKSMQSKNKKGTSFFQKRFAQ